MEKIDVQRLKQGIYRIFWKDGGSSVGAIGKTPNGDRWLCCSNWTSEKFQGIDSTEHWGMVKKVKLIARQQGKKQCGELQEELQEPEKSSLKQQYDIHKTTLATSLKQAINVFEKDTGAYVKKLDFIIENYLHNRKVINSKLIDVRITTTMDN